MDIPRNFRLMDELDGSSKFPGVSYGLQNPEDIDFIYWYGTFITGTGHTINFNFICDDTYPFTSPLFYFDGTRGYPGGGDYYGKPISEYLKTGEFAENNVIVVGVPPQPL